jgi:hypothetical protein
MQFRYRIYIAGAYQNSDLIKALGNMRKGIAASAEFIRLGWAAFCPWIDYQFSFFEDLSRKDYLEYSLSWLEASHLMYVLSDWENSNGTREEIQVANSLEIQTFYQDDISPVQLHEKYLGLYGDNIKEGKAVWR